MKYLFSTPNKSERTVLLSVAVLAAFLLSSTVAFASPDALTTGEAGYAIADSSEIYTVVDQMPEVEGGLPEIYKHIEYPTSASNRGIEGRVFIKFIVNENGDVESPEILKDIGAGCGEAAVKGIKKVKFTPGKHQGKTVKVYYTMPINFQITD
ncbi:energy transducer TonB [Gracilimonas mengyeensis]|uniref:TonB family C-terminal domain-containing protein n=1 Tax=Gracilimonas mengyeensis TaxID=1302730 RepID=A0A521D6P0_9BACT|nr:energy transducer TonB [Gracilimonas mengyeensis]SMO67367.1 TonB family C-terminal domain-containing protein [Gracilimonas mengyeensis]